MRLDWPGGDFDLEIKEEPGLESPLLDLVDLTPTSAITKLGLAGAKMLPIVGGMLGKEAMKLVPSMKIKPTWNLKSTEEKNFLQRFVATDSKTDVVTHTGGLFDEISKEAVGEIKGFPVLHAQVPRGQSSLPYGYQALSVYAPFDAVKTKFPKIAGELPTGSNEGLRIGAITIDTEGVIRDLAVSPAFRGTGIADELVNLAVEKYGAKSFTKELSPLAAKILNRLSERKAVRKK